MTPSDNDDTVRHDTTGPVSAGTAIGIAVGTFVLNQVCLAVIQKIIVEFVFTKHIVLIEYWFLCNREYLCMLCVAVYLSNVI